MVLRVKPKLTRLPTNILHAPVDSTHKKCDTRGDAEDLSNCDEGKPGTTPRTESFRLRTMGWGVQGARVGLSSLDCLNQVPSVMPPWVNVITKAFKQVIRSYLPWPDGHSHAAAQFWSLSFTETFLIDSHSLRHRFSGLKLFTLYRNQQSLAFN